MWKKTVKTTILYIILSIPLMGRAEIRMTTGGIQYSVTGESTVTAYLTVKAQGDVVIQETINIKGKSYKTTRIGQSYTKKNAYLQSVIIPNTVTHIDKYAFRGCSNLSKIIIPNTPCTIDPLAFDGCKAIASVRTHEKGGKIDYLLAAIDPSNPCFTKNVIIIEEEEPEVAQVVIKKKKKAKQAETVIFVDDDDHDDVEEDINIDIDIPKTKGKNNNTFALIIGNEHYKRLSQVPFAANDAQIFKEYCEKTLAIPQKNIEYLPDATQGDIRHGISTLTNCLKANKGEAKAIVYYAGHGIPDENDKTAYLLPVDGFASDVESGYSLEKLYKTLSEAPSQQTVVFLDACFSGAKREGDMLTSTRGVAIKVNKTTPPGNLLVFTASSGEETAICDKEHQHGIFTYYLLRCLRENGGMINFGLLSEYVTDKVQRRSVIINSGKIQTPTVIPSSSIGESWKDIMLK